MGRALRGRLPMALERLSRSHVCSPGFLWERKLGLKIRELACGDKRFWFRWGSVAKSIAPLPFPPTLRLILTASDEGEGKPLVRCKPFRGNFFKRSCGRTKTDNTPLTRFPYFLFVSMLAYSTLVN